MGKNLSVTTTTKAGRVLSLLTFLSSIPVTPLSCLRAEEPALSTDICRPTGVMFFPRFPLLDKEQAAAAYTYAKASVKEMLVERDQKTGDAHPLFKAVGFSKEAKPLVEQLTRKFSLRMFWAPESAKETIVKWETVAKSDKGVDQNGGRRFRKNMEIGFFEYPNIPATTQEIDRFLKITLLRVDPNAVALPVKGYLCPDLHSCQQIKETLASKRLIELEETVHPVVFQSAYSYFPGATATCPQNDSLCIMKLYYANIQYFPGGYTQFISPALTARGAQGLIYDFFSRLDGLKSASDGLQEPVGTSILPSPYQAWVGDFDQGPADMQEKDIRFTQKLLNLSEGDKAFAEGVKKINSFLCDKNGVPPFPSEWPENRETLLEMDKAMNGCLMRKFYIYAKTMEFSALEALSSLQLSFGFGVALSTELFKALGDGKCQNKLYEEPDFTKEKCELRIKLYKNFFESDADPTFMKETLLSQAFSTAIYASRPVTSYPDYHRYVTGYEQCFEANKKCSSLIKEDRTFLAENEALKAENEILRNKQKAYDGLTTEKKAADQTIAQQALLIQELQERIRNLESGHGIITEDIKKVIGDLGMGVGASSQGLPVLDAVAQPPLVSTPLPPLQEPSTNADRGVKKTKSKTFCASRPNHAECRQQIS